MSRFSRLLCRVLAAVVSPIRFMRFVLSSRECPMCRDADHMEWCDMCGGEGVVTKKEIKGVEKHDY